MKCSPFFPHHRSQNHHASFSVGSYSIWSQHVLPLFHFALHGSPFHPACLWICVSTVKFQFDFYECVCVCVCLSWNFFDFNPVVFEFMPWPENDDLILIMYRFMQNSVEMKTEIQFPQVSYAVVVFKGQKSATFFFLNSHLLSPNYMEIKNSQQPNRHYHECSHLVCRSNYLFYCILLKFLFEFSFNNTANGIKH